jgi:hypothetical protein
MPIPSDALTDRYLRGHEVKNKGQNTVSAMYTSADQPRSTCGKRRYWGRYPYYPRESVSVPSADLDDFHVIERQTGTKQELISLEFLTYCPPSLHRHCILALLGTADIGDDDSPGEDGWSASDFYLFHLSLEFPRCGTQKDQAIPSAI